jgi:tRNA-uridine 2-sulfurtransferase
MSPIINTLPTKPTRIAVAMSGGVDSSVAAYLLHQAGHQLVGFTAWTLNGPGKCCNDALVNAGRVCDTLNIPYDTVDLRAEFSHYVMDYYNNSYQAGLTPNPCVECNRYVKWEKLVDYAKNHLDVEYVATGHYARLSHDSHPTTGLPLSRLCKGLDARKDQTYMMAKVHQADLQYTLFPLGDMVKPDVVALAKAIDLPTAYSKESQDICFVLDGQANYLQGVFGKRTGNIVDVDTGAILGQHDGHFAFTVGQRKGVKVAAGRPIYVVKTDPVSNTVYVGDKHHLECSTLTLNAMHWINPIMAETLARNGELTAQVKIRYNTPPCMGLIHPHPTQTDGLLVTLSSPQLAVTPGQIAALYDTEGQELYGGGYIDAHLPQSPFNPDLAKPLPNLHQTCPI